MKISTVKEFLDDSTFKYNRELDPIQYDEDINEFMSDMNKMFNMNGNYGELRSYLYTLRDNYMNYVYDRFFNFYDKYTVEQNFRDYLDYLQVHINNSIEYDRIEIVGTFYNKSSNIIEYKLIDGTYLPINDIKKKQVDFKMEYLPEKLLIKVKENYLRKYNLKQILKNGC